MREQWREIIQMIGDLADSSDESAGTPLRETLQKRFPSRERLMLPALLSRLPGGASLPDQEMQKLLFLMFIKKMFANQMTARELL